MQQQNQGHLSDQMYFVDTNIFLEILLNQSRAEACGKLLDKFYTEDEPIIVSLFSIHSILINLVNRKKYREAKEFITKIEMRKHIFVYRDDLEDHTKIVTLCSEANLDFDDAIQYFIAKQANCESIISYDSDFDDLQIPRKTPDQIKFP